MPDRIFLTAFAAAALAVPAVSAYETPTMGWSSWNTYRVDISDALIRRQADAMVSSGLSACGYDHINIDDGWFGGRDAEGRHTTNPKRFPDGLRPVVDYIHAKGLKAGAYSDGGENTCGSIYDKDVLGIRVGFYGHDDADAAFFFKEMDFDFIKVDFCGGTPRGNARKVAMDERERYTAIRKAIERVGRPEVRMNICRWDYPGTWVHEAGFSWRISKDIKPTWVSASDIINESLYLAPYAYEGRYNDMDMLEVGRGMTSEEDRTHFAMWCVMASPLLIGCDLTAIGPETLALLKNRDLIAVNQDPLGLQAAVVRAFADGRHALVKDLGTLGGTVRCLAFYNPSDAAEMAIDFAEIDLGGKVRARELVEGRDLGVLEGRISCKVPAHGTRVFRLVAERRLERTRYPAHWAFLSGYQELDPKAPTPNYAPDPRDNRERIFQRVGGSDGNYALWRNVLSAKGGSCRLVFDVYPGSGEGFEVVVNGKSAGRAERSNGFSVAATLAPGANTVRLQNPDAVICDVAAMLIR